MEGARRVQSHLGAARPAHIGLKESVHAKDIKKDDIDVKIQKMTELLQTHLPLMS